MSDITRSEAIKQLRLLKADIINGLSFISKTKDKNLSLDSLDMAIKALEQEPSGDCISRTEAIKCLECDFDITGKENMKTVVNYINSAHNKIVNLPSVLPDVDDNNVGELTIHCKDCKFFEYDHFENVFGVPLIVAHEVCTKWGDACKTNENGACFLAERKESEEE